ncbi:hypothetical protein RR48_00813 [Papilio machaon]|uniref:Uncharacterized protein n=1 Tax=Papilio machaon TaxID=76193 RepID=A0A0N1IC91_PAPMA|nr:hypothetical protein RR48_00813 [Papilio machaon]
MGQLKYGWTFDFFNRSDGSRPSPEMLTTGIYCAFIGRHVRFPAELNNVLIGFVPWEYKLD